MIFRPVVQEFRETLTRSSRRKNLRSLAKASQPSLIFTFTPRMTDTNQPLFSSEDFTRFPSACLFPLRLLRRIRASDQRCNPPTFSRVPLLPFSPLFLSPFHLCSCLDASSLSPPLRPFPFLSPIPGVWNRYDPVERKTRNPGIRWTRNVGYTRRRGWPNVY